jgi:hypothetical protein
MSACFSYFYFPFFVSPITLFGFNSSRRGRMWLYRHWCERGGDHRGLPQRGEVDGGTRTGGGMVMEGWRVTMQYKIIGQ